MISSGSGILYAAHEVLECGKRRNASLVQATSIFISSSTVRTDVYKRIRNLPRVTSHTLVSVDISPGVIALIGGMTGLRKLTHLTLAGTGCAGREIGKIVNLTHLTLDHTPTSDESLLNLQSTTLLDLSIVDTCVSIDGVKRVSWSTTPPSLQQLWVTKAVPDEDLRAILHSKPVMKGYWSD